MKISVSLTEIGDYPFSAAELRTIAIEYVCRYGVNSEKTVSLPEALLWLNDCNHGFSSIHHNPCWVGYCFEQDDSPTP